MGDLGTLCCVSAVVSLQTDCSDIQKLVKDSGNLSREIKDLEEQVCDCLFLRFKQYGLNVWISRK